MRLLLRVAFIAIAIVLTLLALMFAVRLAHEWDALPTARNLRDVNETVGEVEPDSISVSLKPQTAGRVNHAPDLA